MNNYKWYKTDTAAIMFSAIRRKDAMRIFRIAFILKNKEVDVSLLRQATEDTMNRFPYFSARVRDGFFWSYLEHTDILPQVVSEAEQPCAVQWHGRNGGPELRVVYYKRRFAVEISHILTDGTGAFEFAKALAARYLTLCGYNPENCFENVIDTLSPMKDEEYSNAYSKFYSGKPAKKEFLDKTHAMGGKLLKDYVYHINGLMPVEDIKRESAKHNVTVTAYLCAAAILAVIRVSEKPVTDTVRIAVPINIRQFFPSETLRNFACDTDLSFEPKGRTDITFEEILDSIRGVLAKKITKQNLQNFIDSTHSLAVNPILKIVPFVIKKPVVNSMQIKSHVNSSTLIISNLGNVELPSWMSEKIERIDVQSGNGALYGLPILSTLASFNGYLNICYSVCKKDDLFCREFFRILANEGIAVRIESTELNGFDSAERNPQGKRCRHCDVDLGEEYTVCPLCGNKATNEKKKIDAFRTAEYAESFKNPDHGADYKENHRLSKERVKAYFNLKFN